MNPIFKYIWVAFIVFPVINYFRTKTALKEITDSKPDLKEGYDKISKGLLIFSIIPWIIVGIGNLLESTQSIFDYFNPKTFNPFVLTFHFYLIVVFVLTTWWIYFNDGAVFLSKHPGFIRFQGFGSSKDITSPRTIKIFFALCLLGGIAALIMMWSMDFSHMTKFKMHMR